MWMLIPGAPETEGGESNVDNGEREADRPLAHREILGVEAQEDDVA